MMTSMHCRIMLPGEEEEISELVHRTFMEDIAPVYSREGVEEFTEYCRPSAIGLRARANHRVLVAEYDHEMAGILEIRDFSHITMFFVEKGLQRQGIGRELLKLAITYCRTVNSRFMELTVYASPNAVTIYERLGFSPGREEQTVKGIRFLPMALTLGGT